MKEVNIEKEKVIKVKPRMVKTFIGTPMNEKPDYLKDMPNQKLHKVVSFVKSAIRILSCIVGVMGMYEFGFFGLVVAEVVGIIEEMV